jgi:hypothetical protein
MPSASFFSPIARRLPGLALALLAAHGAAGAQQLVWAEGAVRHSTPADRRWLALQPRQTLGAGDRLWADGTTRAELALPSALLRIDRDTVLDLADLARLRLTQGALDLEVDPATVARIEIATPNLALVAAPGGRYRIDVNPDQRLTRVAVLQGSATAYGEDGRALGLPPGTRRDFVGRGLASPGPLAGAVADDDFDRWVRDRQRPSTPPVAPATVYEEYRGYPADPAYGYGAPRVVVVPQPVYQQPAPVLSPPAGSAAEIRDLRRQQEWVRQQQFEQFADPQQRFQPGFSQRQRELQRAEVELRNRREAAEGGNVPQRHRPWGMPR